MFLLRPNRSPNLPIHVEVEELCDRVCSGVVGNNSVKSVSYAR